jgi:aminoglycoside phosphotransferase (APT) family kinase protein
MFTKPSVDELIEGVSRTLQQVVFPLLEDVPDAQQAIAPCVAVLGRAMSEWANVGADLVADNEDIDQTLSAIAATVAGEPVASDVQRVIAGLPAQPAGLCARDLAERNVRLKEGVIELMVVLDLPASRSASPTIHDADVQVRELLRRLCEREIAASALDVSSATSNLAVKAAPDPIDEMSARLQRYIHHAVRGDGDGHRIALLDGQPVGTPDVEVTNLERIVGGASRDTWFFDVTYQDPAGHAVEEHCVLQEEAISSVLESDEAEGKMTGSRRRPETEAKVIAALESTGIPVPKILWTEATGEWLGQPFCISRRIPGTSDDSPLFEEGNEAAREKVYENYVDILGRLHALDVDEVGLDFLGTPTIETAAAEQVDLFELGYRKQRLEPHPAVDYVIRWCRRNLPVAARVSLIHGDFRRGNFLYEGDAITALVDWEQCHLGDPMEEIAFMYWSLWTLESVLPLDQLLAMYEEASGIEVNRETLAFYRIFIELKMVVVCLTGIKAFLGTEERQLQYALSPTAMATETMLRVLKELDAGGPTYDYQSAADAVRLI